MTGSRIRILFGKVPAFTIVLLMGLGFSQGISPCRCPSGILGQNESVLMLTAQTQSGTCRNEALVGLFSLYLNTNQKDAARAVLTSLESTTFQGCEDSLLAEYTWLRGRYFFLLNNADSNIACLTRAADLASSTGNHFLEVKCLGDIARSYTMSNLFDQALEYYRKCLFLSEKHHFVVHLDNLYGNLATTYGFIFGAGGGEQYLDSVEWAEHISIRYAAQTKDSSSLVFAYSNLANVHLNRGNTALAFLYCDSILRVAPFGTGPYLSALSTKSEAYHQREDLPNAIRYADSALVVAQLVGTPLEKVIAMEILSGFLAEAGRFEEALTLHKQLKTLEDSINNVERTRVIGDLEQSFNKERNEQTIASLTKDAEIQDLNIRILAGIVLVAILILVIAAILYRQQTLRTRQKMMETELRLNRARMDPHFFFNMLTALQGLALDPERAAKVPIYLAQYSRLMRRTLESTYLEMVSIADEADFLNAYLELQSVRFPGKFTWEIDIDPELDPEAVKVPAMLIQPFAENAVEHGFKAMSGGGTLLVSFKKHGNALVIAVKDNGSGGKDVDKSHTSRATQIVQDRLYLINQQSKSACTFHAGPNSDGPGFSVSIHLPLNLK